MNQSSKSRAAGFGIPLTCIIVTYNESARLKKCLESISFCDQIVHIDLGSTDGSTDISRQYGARIFYHPRVRAVECVLSFAFSKALNDWILIMDPDEVFNPILLKSIYAIISGAPDVGMISLPFQYYFMGKKIRTTVWGGIKHIPRVCHRDRVLTTGKIHQGLKLADNFRAEKADAEGLHPVRHYWIDSCGQFLYKHMRYIREEGRIRFLNGERFRFTPCIRDTKNAFIQNFVDLNGRNGGWQGFFLSGMYAWYVFMCHISLLAYQIYR